MERRSFLKGVLGTTAVTLIPAAHSKELILKPEKPEIVLPVTVESIRENVDLRPPFGVTSWRIDIRDAVDPWSPGIKYNRVVEELTVEGEILSSDEYTQLYETVTALSAFEWNLPLRHKGNGDWEMLYVRGVIGSSELSSAAFDGFGHITVKAIVLEKA